MVSKPALYLEPPYDRGFTWTLIHGEEKARIAEDIYYDLYNCGLTVDQGDSTVVRNIDLPLLRKWLSKNPHRLSMKAQRLIKAFLEGVTQ